VLLSDLTHPRRINEARRVMQRHPARWFVLTDAEEGAAWGAVLDAGAVAVLPSATPLLRLLDLLDEAGSADLADPRRTELVLEWRAVEAETERMLGRMHALSPRERSILRLLYAGESVRSIADRLEVSESTVRSQVRSVLRKLDVSSQLAAVAAIDALLALEGVEDPGSGRLAGLTQPIG
jgi:RNA polymerase sigma factor (sigma-70 family)